MRRLICLLGVLLLAAGVLPAQNAPAVPYKIEFDPRRDVQIEHKGTLMVTVNFTISIVGAATEAPGTIYKVVIEENGHRVKEVDIPQPMPSDDLSAVLVLDTSGSMREHGRMDQARVAANVFLDKLPKKADCGLILFDHEIRQTIQPLANRQLLRQQIDLVKPRGGTAYLDAAFKGIELLSTQPSNKERALVLLTDGIDLNSKKSVEDVLAKAKEHRVRIYTIGIGEPGKLEAVSTALVLDHSGSMTPPADDVDKKPKIQALHDAGSRFVGFIPSTGRVSLIPFSSTVGVPQPFSNEKFRLADAIKKLEPKGETALFDAVYTAIATLEADGAKGKRVVVAMTDGVDNSSRRRVEEVIDRAKEAKIPVYMLGFGRKHEIDEVAMEQVAKATGGKYYHARNAESLIEIFENLSIDIHDDGIDEEVLKRLAHKTGGDYYHAREVGQLRLILERVTTAIQRIPPYKVPFASLFQTSDGTARNIGIHLERQGLVVSNKADGRYTVVRERIGEGELGVYQVTGLIVAEMNHLIYLVLLVVLAVLIALPAWLKRLTPRTY